MTLIGSINNQGNIQGQINDANGILTGVITSAGQLGGQIVGMRGLPGEQGEQGEQGETGVGIQSVAKTSSSGLVDTYTITFTDGTTTTYTLTNGKDGTDGADGTDGVDGHSPVVTASKVGKVTTVSVDGSAIATINDGNDGQDGSDGQDGADGQDGFSPIASVSKVGDTATITITDEDGTTTASVTDGTDGVDGQDGADGADGADGFSPSASVSKVGSVATITITDKDGTTTAEVYDGSGGASAFIAEYGESSYAEVYSAYEDGSVILCHFVGQDDEKLIALVSYDPNENRFLFTSPTDYGEIYTALNSGDEWADGYTYFAPPDTATQLRDGLMTALDKQKLDGIASGAEVNVQSDWNQSTNTADDYIKNKPTTISGYGITDAKISSGTITLGGNTITPLTSFTETDPIFTASDAYGITSSDISNWNANDPKNVWYGTCTTGASTQAKVATTNSGDFVLSKGNVVFIRFGNGNTYNGTATLSIDGKTAKDIHSVASTTTTRYYWKANELVCFVYDGTAFVMVEKAPATTTYYGITKLSSSTSSTSEALSATPKAVKTAYDLANGKQDALVSGTNIKTINGISILGSGDLSLIDMFYPVGSYYETSDVNFDPNVTWGGTWEMETSGQVHVSAGGGYLVNGATTNTSDGGSKDAVVIYHTHKVSSGWQTASGQPDRITYSAVNGGYNNTGNGNVQFLEGVGVSGTDKNMPPYIVVCRWHRTA